MKRKITTLLVAISIIGSLSAQTSSAQKSCSTPSKDSQCDKKLLSTTTQGDYTVSRYLVKERNGDDDDFSVKYQINLSRLISTYSDNAKEITDLRNFIESIQRDTLRRITSVSVTGFASPDGSAVVNERLAMQRAVDFRQYIDRNYSMSTYGGTTKADALTWADAYDATSKSSIPNKEAVLTLLKSSHSQYDIEAKLKSMPESWSYMRQYILPPMRSVELCVKYNSWKVVEYRTLVKPCVEVVEPVIVPYFVVVVQEPRAMVVNPKCSPLDYDEKFKRRGIKEKFKVNRRRRIYIRRR